VEASDITGKGYEADVCNRTLSVHTLIPVILVFTTIQDKLNNPSPDDPFNPDIAAVSVFTLIACHVMSKMLLQGIEG
jgi:hypothetical protein